MANTSRIDIDVDKQGDFEVCFAKLKDVKTKNFMVCFNAAKAVCRVDADADHLEHLLSSPNKGHTTRWINFWAGTTAERASSTLSRRGTTFRLAC